MLPRFAGRAGSHGKALKLINHWGLNSNHLKNISEGQVTGIKQMPAENDKSHPIAQPERKIIFLIQ